MEKEVLSIQCIGRCRECEFVLNGQIEDPHACAIEQINRRTFQQTKLIEKIVELVESQKPKKKPQLPIVEDITND